MFACTQPAMHMKMTLLISSLIGFYRANLCTLMQWHLRERKTLPCNLQLPPQIQGKNLISRIMAMFQVLSATAKQQAQFFLSNTSVGTR